MRSATSRRRRYAPAFAVVAVAFAPSPAFAHVEVAPATFGARAEQQFTMQVPNERDIPTTRIVVTFPRGLNVFSFASSPGWRKRVLLTADRRVRGVIYSAGSIPVRGYDEFRFLATAQRPGTYLWRVQQVYADGKTKPWTGPPERRGAPEKQTGLTAPGPAPATRATAAGAKDAAAAQPVDAGSSGPSSAGIWLGLIAIAIAAIAVLATGFLWSTRPADLPVDASGLDDDPRRPGPRDPQPPPDDAEPEPAQPVEPAPQAKPTGPRPPNPTDAKKPSFQKDSQRKRRGGR